MYVLIKRQPRDEDMKFFNMRESINENFINFSIDTSHLSTEEKQILISKYKLDTKALSHKGAIFLCMPNSKKKTACI